jgi:serine/threonine-protein kinase HipA
MTISRSLVAPREAFVWVWLPDRTAPVVAGRLVADGGRVGFVYGRSYRARPDAIALYLPELPVREGLIPPLDGLPMANAIRDAGPDAWGRRVILNRVFGLKGSEIDGGELDELTFLLQSGSDRIGALDFQSSATNYVARGGEQASLAALMASAEKVERNLPLSTALDQALHHGSSIGGARPKALIDDGARKYVAKFSATTDSYSVVKGEYIAMRLAAIAGLNVAPVKLTHVAGKDVLLVERFDRTQDGDGWRRKGMVSALTMLGLDEMQARYASYQDLAEIIRFRFTKPGETLREMFGRMCFNILVGNVDDHARNHAAFWDGADLTLTPAYDICPQARAGEEASQAMLIVGQDRASRIAICLAAAGHFQLDEAASVAIVAGQVRAIGDHWLAICGEAKLGEVDRALFWGRQFLNPYAFYGLVGGAAPLVELAARYRSGLA